MFLFVFAFINNLFSQQTLDKGLDASLAGYLFQTKYGLFFQPVLQDSRQIFLETLNNMSFSITESNLFNYSEVLKGVGKKIVVIDIKEDNNLLKRDTISYFKAKIKIILHFDDKYKSINHIEHKFKFEGKVFSYGKNFLYNDLYQIIPFDKSIVKQIYTSYLTLYGDMPAWIKKLYIKEYGKYIK